MDNHSPFQINVNKKSRELTLVTSDNPLIKEHYSVIQELIGEHEDCSWTDHTDNHISNKRVKEELYTRFENWGVEDNTRRNRYNDVHQNETSNDIFHKDKYPYDISDGNLREEVVKISRCLIPHIFKELNELGILSLEHVSNCHTCKSYDISMFVRQVVKDDSFVFPCVSFHSQSFMEQWFRNLHLPVDVHLRDTVEVTPIFKDTDKDTDIVSVKNLTGYLYNGKETITESINYPQDDFYIENHLNEVVDDVFKKYGFTESTSQKDGLHGYKTSLESLRKTYYQIVDSTFNNTMNELFEDVEGFTPKELDVSELV